MAGRGGRGPWTLGGVKEHPVPPPAWVSDRDGGGVVAYGGLVGDWGGVAGWGGGRWRWVWGWRWGWGVMERCALGELCDGRRGGVGGRRG